MLGRWLFVGLCILPTAAVLIWGFAQNRPGYTESWEQRLSRRLRLSVTVERVGHPRPGVTVLQNVRISDPETNSRIARIRVVEAYRDDDSTVLVFSQPLVEGKQVGALWRLLHREITNALDPPPGKVQVVCSELTCDVGDTAVTLTDVVGQIEADSAARIAAFDFRIAGQQMVEPAQVRLVRMQQGGEPLTRVEFHTGGNELPCSLLAPYTQWDQRVGSDCRFCGSYSGQRTREGWAADVAGRLSRLSLDRLVGAVFPHKMSSEAQVDLRSLRFVDSRLQSAEGSVSTGPGVVSRSLVHAVADAGIADETESLGGFADSVIPFEQLAFTFRVDADGLSVLGACDDPTPGAILAARNGPLLVQPRRQPVPAVALVRALVPQSSVQVPATLETDLLLRVLPIPSIRAPEDIRTATPYIRFGGGVERW
jgi:hypothetical protein